MTARLSTHLLLLALAGCAVPPAARDAELTATGRIEEPDLAALEDGRLAATWAVVDDEGSADIVLAVFDPETRSWGSPHRVNRAPGSAVAGRQVGPRVATGPGGTIAVCWVDRERDPAGDLLFAASKDEGRTFSDALRVNDDPGAATGQEYHEIAVAPDGTIHVVWLDERDAPADYENQKQLYAAVSRDGGSTFSANFALTSSPRGVCPCCRPSLATGVDGSVHVVYRDRDGETLFIRARSRRSGDEDFAAPVTLSEGWTFPGCPVNGPAIETGPSGEVWAVWVEDTRLCWGRSDDQGASFTARGAVDPRAGGFAGAASHLALASSPATGTFATWEDAAGRICLLPLPAAGDGADAAPRVVSGDDGVFARSPAVEAAGGAVYVCWSESPPASSLNGAAAPRLAVLVPSAGGGPGVLVPIARGGR